MSGHKQCPNCGYKLAVVSTKWVQYESDLVNLETGETEVFNVGFDGEGRKPLYTNKTVTCRHCDTQYLLDTELFDKVRY